MTLYCKTVAQVRRTLRDVASDVEPWFDVAEDLQRFRPATGGWTISEVLEHITLTNHFLLLTCEKYRAIALQRAGRGDRPPDGESDLDRMAVIGERSSFVWKRPEHMVPKGGRPVAHFRTVLQAQWSECHAVLDSLAGGEGALCAITMSVNALGKIDLYQWIYFLALHARRHVQQMEAIRREFSSANAG